MLSEILSQGDGVFVSWLPSEDFTCMDPNLDWPLYEDDAEAARARGLAEQEMLLIPIHPGSSQGEAGRSR